MMMTPANDYNAVLATQTAATPLTITTSWLRSQDAFVDQVECFAKVFGESAEFTRANLRIVAEHPFDLDWIAQNLLTAQVWQEYERIEVTVSQKYGQSTIKALNEYTRVKTEALKKCMLLKTEALKEYMHIKAEALKEYRQAIALALREYRRAMVEILADLLDLPAE